MTDHRAIAVHHQTQRVAAETKLDAIASLHVEVELVRPLTRFERLLRKAHGIRVGDAVCTECYQAWPCTTARILNPEAGA